MELTKVKCPQNKIEIKCPYKMNAEFIIVHNTANKVSAMAEISYMLGNNKYVSFHFAIDDKRIVQGIEENRNSWNSGDGRYGKGNRNGIAIEICYSKNGGELFSKSELLTAKFIAYKLKEKGWGIDKIKKHQDFNGKYCPHRTLDLGWQRFLNLIKIELGQDIKNELEEKDMEEILKELREINSKLDKALNNKSVNVVATKKSINEIAKEVIDGKWGNGVDRENRLKKAGYNAKAVQDKVNEMLR
jgi:hypothetical protein